MKSCEKLLRRYLFTKKKYYLFQYEMVLLISDLLLSHKNSTKKSYNKDIDQAMTK